MNRNKEKIITAIHQPNYIPWLGYFYKIYQSDIFVFLDDAQFSNEGMHNYHYIKTPQGPFRLKIPVVQKMGDKIYEVKTKDNLDWKQKHLKTIENNYKRAPYFSEVYSHYENFLLKNYESLSAMNTEIIKYICTKFGISTEFVIASALNVSSVREEKILDICERLNAKVYYSGTGARAYQNEDNFNQRNIELRYSVYHPFEYPQFFGDFQTNVTILDYLMHCGYDWERVIIQQEK